MTVKQASSFILRMLGQPIVLISLFGPTIVHLHFVFARDIVGLTGRFPEAIRGTVHNLWAYAMVDYSLQIYTLVLAYVFLFVTIFSIGAGFLENMTLRELKRTKFVSSFSNVLLVLVVGTLILLPLFVLLGVFGGPHLIAMYLPVDESHIGRYKLPPLESPITWARAELIGIAGMLSIWQERSQPKIIK